MPTAIDPVSLEPQDINKLAGEIADAISRAPENNEDIVRYRRVLQSVVKACQPCTQLLTSAISVISSHNSTDRFRHLLAVPDVIKAKTGFSPFKSTTEFYRHALKLSHKEQESKLGLTVMKIDMETVTRTQLLRRILYSSAIATANNHDELVHILGQIDRVLGPQTILEKLNNSALDSQFSGVSAGFNRLLREVEQTFESPSDSSIQVVDLKADGSISDFGSDVLGCPKLPPPESPFPPFQRTFPGISEGFNITDELRCGIEILRFQAIPLNLSDTPKITAFEPGSCCSGDEITISRHGGQGKYPCKNNLTF